MSILNSMKIKIGKVIVLLKSEPPLINTFQKYYSLFICDEERHDFQIEVYIDNLRNKSLETITLFERDFFHVFCSEADNYLNLYVDHIKHRATIVLQNDFCWEKNWASWEFCFRMATFREFAYRYQIMIHSAGILLDNKIVLITGESGAGKTTTALNCVRENGQCTILNDDTMIVYKRDDTWFVSTAPYRSTSGILPVYGSAPLAGLYRVHKSLELELQPMEIAEVIQQLWTHTFSVGDIYSADSNLRKHVFEFVTNIAHNTKNYHLYAPLHPNGLFQAIHQACKKEELI